MCIGQCTAVQRMRTICDKHILGARGILAGMRGLDVVEMVVYELGHIRVMCTSTNNGSSVCLYSVHIDAVGFAGLLEKLKRRKKRVASDDCVYLESH